VVMTFKVVNIIAKRPMHAKRKYDRDFLLSTEKRNQLIDLWEVEKYGKDCFGDPNHVHLYGMPPKEWYGRGVRILARTCLEAVKDPLGNKIGGKMSPRWLRVCPTSGLSGSSTPSLAHVTGFTRFCGTYLERRASSSRSSQLSLI